jgi:hypothetical protein
MLLARPSSTSSVFKDAVISICTCCSLTIRLGTLALNRTSSCIFERLHAAAKHGDVPWRKEHKAATNRDVFDCNLNSIAAVGSQLADVQAFDGMHVGGAVGEFQAEHAVLRRLHGRKCMVE